MKLDKFCIWLGLGALAMGPACDKDERDDGMNSGGGTVAASAGMTDGNEQPTGGTATTEPGGTGETGDAGATEPQTPGTTTDDGLDCDPACPAGQQCFAGDCVPDPNGEGSGGTPMECNVNVTFEDAPPECGTCVGQNCCDVFEACVGTGPQMTACFQLNQCIATNCEGQMTQQALQMCIQANCPELAGEFGAWAAFNQCIGMNCLSACQPS